MVVHAVGADMNFARLYEATDILTEKKRLALSSKFQVTSGFFIMAHYVPQSPSTSGGEGNG